MKNLIAVIFFLLPVLLTYPQEKPAIIVLTDTGGDTDDEQSMVRFLLYSDMLDVRAICITSRMGHGQDIKPEIVYNQIEAYRSVYPNLLLHSQGYPTPDYLLSIVKYGQGDHASFGKGYDTEASGYIIQVIDESDVTVHVAVWGGLRELAQALWKVKETRTQEQVDEFCRKILVHDINDQDHHRDWITGNFPAIRFIANGYNKTGSIWGVRELATFRGMYMTGDVSMQDGDWVRKNVHGHGPLSDTYQLHGHGTDGMKEGDTPTFLGLICNGLNAAERPDWGGWGGRYRILRNNLYIDAPDFLNGKMNERHTVSRWRPAFQNDFMARLKWCVEPYGKVNRNPVAAVNGMAEKSPIFINAAPGQELVFDASESYDPDGDELSFNWFFYYEIYFPGCAVFTVSSDGSICTVKVPESTGDENLHLILEVTDNNSPSLTGYKRIIINVTESNQ
ncbi:MAG: nucleoside hydrolase-like domain-containing protein [Bacteroidales bacterium]